MDENKLKELSEDSVRIIGNIIANENLSSEIVDIVVALSQGGLINYMASEGLNERFGRRVKKSDELSIIFRVINGMANEIERLKKLTEEND